MSRFHGISRYVCRLNRILEKETEKISFGILDMKWF